MRKLAVRSLLHVPFTCLSLPVPPVRTVGMGARYYVTCATARVHELLGELFRLADRADFLAR